MSGQRYTNAQLSAIRSIRLEKGHLFYHMGYELEKAYTEKCGDNRSSGELYMANWRMEKGRYSHRGF